MSEDSKEGELGTGKDIRCAYYVRLGHEFCHGQLELLLEFHDYAGADFVRLPECLPVI